MATNAMRLLSQARIPYEPREYPVDESDLSGVHAAESLGIPPEQLFKTLVLSGERTGLFVCLIPCAEAIDLRKAAKAAGDKACTMLPMKELLDRVGYVRGACSPIGMKKRLPTFIDETWQLHEKIAVSAGIRGTMLLVSPDALAEYAQAKTCDLIDLS